MDKLNAEGLINAEVIQLDVSDQASVDLARAEIGGKTEVLDALVNNAGVNGGMPQTALNMDIEKMNAAFNVNVYGVVRTCQAFIDLLRQSAQPRIVNVPSSGCSLTLNSDPTWRFYDHKAAIYQPSKAAMNMIVLILLIFYHGIGYRLMLALFGFYCIYLIAVGIVIWHEPKKNVIINYAFLMVFLIISGLITYVHLMMNVGGNSLFR